MRVVFFLFLIGNSTADNDDYHYQGARLAVW